MILLQLVPSSPNVPSKISHGKLDAAIPRFHDSYRKSVRHQLTVHCSSHTALSSLTGLLSHKQLLFLGADTGLGQYRRARATARNQSRSEITGSRNESALPIHHVIYHVSFSFAPGFNDREEGVSCCEIFMCCW